jgi:hypothetical protein
VKDNTDGNYDYMNANYSISVYFLDDNMNALDTNIPLDKGKGIDRNINSF